MNLRKNTPSILLIGTILLTLGLLPSFARQARKTTAPQPPESAQASTVLQPLAFEENHGQTNEQVRFLVRASNQHVFLTPSEVVLKMPVKPARPGSGVHDTDIQKPGSAVLRLQFDGAAAQPALVGQDQLPGVVNYYLGQDPAGWHAGVPTYAAVRYQDLYPGIDVLFYGNEQQVEYDFIVAPGRDPRKIAIRVQGADGLRLNKAGDLLLDSAGGPVTLRRPVIYQVKNGQRQFVAGSYVLGEKNTFGFAVAGYDASLPLVIDPVIDFSTYFGGSGADYGYGIAVDTAGNVYMTGATGSPDFPGGSGYMGAGSQCPSDLPTRECYDAFVTKVNAAGTAILYTTYIGNPGEDEGRSIAVDSDGNAYITGLVSLPGDPPLEDLYIYPYTLVIKLDSNGGMVYGFAWGTSSGGKGHGIAVDGYGQAYVTGEVTGSILTTPGALQPEKGEMIDGFVSVFNAEGTAVLYSTYLGGNDTYCGVCSSTGNAIAVDKQGMIYVTGQAAPSFPTTANAYRSLYDGLWEAFVVKIDPTKSGLAGLVYATYLGGVKTEVGTSIALDSAGLVYITGSTDSDDFPTTANAFDRQCGSDGVCNPTTVCDYQIPPRCYTDPKTDIFVAKMDLTKSGASSLLYATYVGGSGQDKGQAIVVDGAGNAYVAGYSWSPDFPMANPLDGTYANNDDIVLFKISSSGSLPFSTYIGGGGEDHAYALALAPGNSLYMTGYTGSAAFPVVNPLLSRSGDIEAFLTRVTFGSEPPGAFNKTAPAHGTAGVSTSAALSWHASSNAASYQYCYDTTNDNACSNWVSTGTLTYANLSGLDPGTTYYWQVRSVNNTGTTYANGGWYAFTTASNLKNKLFLPWTRR